MKTTMTVDGWHDAVLPQLPDALDERLMAAAFAEALAGRGTEVQACYVERVKYRPLRNCTLSYRLQLRDTHDDRVFEQRVAARLSTGGDVARRAVRASSAPLSASPAGPALRLLPALSLLTWWWPNDAKLAAPRALHCEATVRDRLLPPLVAALSEGRGQYVAHELAIAQYVPEQRVTACVHLCWREADGLVVERTVYAKASREPDVATAHALLQALQASPAWQEGHLRTPAPLLCQPEFGLHWQSAVPGRAWLDVPRERTLALSAALGAQLAALHAVPVAEARELSSAALQERLQEAVQLLAQVLPSARARLERLLPLLLQGLQRFAAGPLATLHGDLHPRNILVDGSRLGLIDLDGLRRGPALLELGAWMADGIYRAALGGLPSQSDAAAWCALLDGYARAGGTRFDHAALTWATAWNLIAPRALRCIVNLKPGRWVIAPRLIEQAEALLQGDALALEAA